jgi:hypothetical protein
VSARASYPELDWKSVREAFEVFVVAFCPKCDYEIGRWREGGEFPPSLRKPCPCCGHETEFRA